MTNHLQNNVLSLLVKYPNIPITLAFSGGVDSQVLLHALAELTHQNKLKNTIHVCHVHHGLSNNADEWAKFAEQQAKKYDLFCHIIRVNVDINSSESLEEQARNARYQALLSVTPKEGMILTGHHSDDQTETLLLALKRGAGVKGLSSMQEVSIREQRLLLRPLLTCERSVIECYAKEFDLPWVEDESNSDTRFDRNFIRQEIVPLLKQRWPSINTTINRSASHCFESQLLLDELAEMDLAVVQQVKGKLQIDALLSLSMARFNNLIRYFLASYQCELPSKAQLAELHQQLFAAHDKTPAVKCGDHWLRRYQKQLYLTPEFEDISAWCCNVDLSSENPIHVTLPDGLGQITFNHQTISITHNVKNLKSSQCILMPKSKQKVSIKFRHENPRCHPGFRQHSRPLKKVLQELELAPWQRKRIPFLYYDERLVAAIGQFVCREYLPDDNQVTSGKMQVVYAGNN